MTSFAIPIQKVKNYFAGDYQQDIAGQYLAPAQGVQARGWAKQLWSEAATNQSAGRRTKERSFSFLGP
jgi:hypothetical protein